VSAFSLTSALDAAGVVELDPGSYTMLMSGVGDTTGIGLAEIYVLDAANNRGLINLSARAEVGPGERVLIPGFVIGGTQPMQVLIRGVGPELARFGVANPLADPTMEVIDQNTKAVLASNDNWGSAANLAELKAAMTAEGAFSLAEGSADSAVLVTLPPGSYTAVISGKGDATGIALMEVYPILPY
jgi:hypothetical protein